LLVLRSIALYSPGGSLSSRCTELWCVVIALQPLFILLIVLDRIISEHVLFIIILLMFFFFFFVNLMFASNVA